MKPWPFAPPRPGHSGTGNLADLPGMRNPMSPVSLIRRPAVGVVVRVLPTALLDAVEFLRGVELCTGTFTGLLGRQAIQITGPRFAGLDAIVHPGYDLGMAVKGTDGDCHLRPLQEFEGERCAAGRTEAAPGGVGTLEIGQRPPADAEGLPWHIDPRGEGACHLLLAHAAMAEIGVPGWRQEVEAHRAALATAGPDVVFHENLPGFR